MRARPAVSVSFVETWMKGRTIAEWESRRETEFEVTFWSLVRSW